MRSQCAHWLRNDTVNKRCGIRLSGGVRAPRPTEGLQEVPACGRTEASAPTEALQGVQWAGDRKGRPYGGLR